MMKRCMWQSRKFLSTTSLASSFNAASPQPGTSSQPTGFFCDPEVRTPEDFRRLNEEIRARSQVLVDEACRGKWEQTRKTVEIFDDLSNTICRGADMMECLRLLHPKEEIARSAEESMMDFTDLVESLNTNQELYGALKRVQGGKDVFPTDSVDRRVTDLLLADFEASGVHLSEHKRKEFVDLSREIFQVGAEFTRGADEPVMKSKHGLSGSLLPHIKLGVGVAVVDSPLSGSGHSFVREWGYRTYYEENERQEELLRRLIDARQRLAHLTGFDNFADRAQKLTFLETSEKVESFLRGVIDSIGPIARSEAALLSRDLDRVEPGAEMGIWDLPFLCGHHRNTVFGVHRDGYAEYLSLGTVMEGLSGLLTKLYGVSLRYEDVKEGEVWDQSLHKLLLPDGVYQSPIVVLSLFLENATATERVGRPMCLLSPSQVENLFHEMGHAVHSMLARTRYQHVAGTRCSTDLAEVPSNLMEYFFYDPRVLTKLVARSFTDEARMLPLTMAENLCGARYALSGLELQQQALYGLYDLVLHRDELKGSTTELFRRLSKETLPLGHPEGTAWQHRFTHTVPYGAKYYSYLVAKASASLIWQKVFKRDPFSREEGLKWMRAQSFGGEMPTKWILKEILGFEPEPMHLIEALHRECDTSRNSAEG